MQVLDDPAVARTGDPAGPGAPSGEPLGLRERKKRARRDALIDAAQDLARAHGLDAVTVEAVCEVAGVSPRTFFNYFETKDDAVLGVQPWEVDPGLVAAFVAGGPTGRLADDVVHLVRGLVTGAAPRPERMACAMEIARTDPRLLLRGAAMFERHHARVAEIVAARLGEHATALRTELATVLVLSTTRAAVVHWEASGRTGDPGDLVPAVVAELRALLDGPPPPGP